MIYRKKQYSGARMIFFLIAVAIGATACQETSGGKSPQDSLGTDKAADSNPEADMDEPPVSADRVWAQPADGTSSMGETPIRVGILSERVPVDNQVFEEFVGAISLVTWPEGEVIENVSIKSETLQDPDGYHVRRNAVLTPENLDPEKVYALQVESLPSGISIYPDGGLVFNETIRAWLARFVIVEFAAIPGYEICQNDANEWTNVEVHLSERGLVDERTPELFRLEAKGEAVACEMLTPPRRRGTDGQLRGEKDINFRCHPLGENTNASISYKGGLKSLGGQEFSSLRLKTSFKTSFSIGDLERTEARCRWIPVWE